MYAENNTNYTFNPNGRRRFETDSIRIDDTNFIFDTNFAGDPSKDKYGDSRRKCKILLTSQELIDKMLAEKVLVYSTKPGKYDDPNTFVPEFFVVAQVKYRKRDGTPVKYPPRVYLHSNGVPVELNEESVGCLDDVRVKKVDVVVYPWQNEKSANKSLYVKVMYVTQDVSDDPYYDKYRAPQRSHEDEVFLDEE